MSDEETHAKFNELDREPSTGEAIHVRRSEPEHADLNHRIEIDALDERQASASRERESTAVQPLEPSPSVQPIQPVRTAANPVTENLPHAGPGLMVLQWLVYAFWGWTVLALSGLVLLVVSQLIGGNNGDYSVSYSFGGGVAYLLAAVLVLFIISLICDLFYASAERKHARSSGTNVIMIIHAVIFALFGIGSLIMSVFGGVSLLIGETTDTSGPITSIISGGIIFVLYGMTLLRTLRPSWIKGVVQLYWAVMTIAIIAAVTLGVIGPAAQSRLRSQDMVLEQGLPPLSRAINVYASENSKLPSSLSDLNTLSDSDYSDEARKLVDGNLVDYKPGEKLSSATPNVIEKDGQTDQLGGASAVVYHYELCVDYKTSDGYETGGYNYAPEDQKYYVGINTFGHTAGKVCYDAQTDYTN